MADRKSLGLIGFVFAGITAVVMATGILVVQRHIDGRLILDEQRPVVSASLPTLVR
jgi:hypothetical protein